MKLPGNLGLKASSIKYISTGVAALGVLAFAAQADAADMYAPGPGPAPFPVAAPVALWSGLYGGAHIGGAWADVSTHDLDAYWTYKNTDTRYSALTNYGVLHTNQSPSGVFGGGTIGYNMQRGGIVFGIEADFGDMGLNRNQFLSYPVGKTAPTADAHISTGFYGDVTGRIGWAWGPWMLYGKGGLAVLDAKLNVSDSGVGYVGYGTETSAHVGWTAGGGVEYLWNPAWSVKVEYQYFDFGTSTSSVTTYPTGFGGAFDHDLTINTVKVGLNYHLGCCDSGFAPLK
jgi:opacity protein-like surface antigen